MKQNYPVLRPAMLKALQNHVVDTDSEEGLQELYNLYFDRGREVPSWIKNKMLSLGLGDKIHGQDDGEPPAYIARQHLDGY